MSNLYVNPLNEDYWPLSKMRRASIVAYLEPLMQFAANAPATDPGEGYWDTIETAFGCGENAATYQAAEMVRGVLTSLGLEAPTGYALCPGCSRAADGDEGHDADCTVAESDELS